MPEEETPDFFRLHPAVIKAVDKGVDQPDLLDDTFPVLDTVEVHIAHDCLERVPDLVV